MKSLDDHRARRGPTARLLIAGTFGAATALMLPPVAAQDGMTVTRSTMKVADTPVLLGDPYTQGGQTVTPADIVDYDDVGRVAILPLGGERVTVRGEPYDGNAMVASHPTLPLPTYVEVTELAGGRTILVRVADRGPGRPGALLGVSPGVARALGLEDGAPVRIRRVNPPEAERALLRNFQAAQERLPTPDSLLIVLRKKAAALNTAGSSAVAVEQTQSAPVAKPIAQPSPSTKAAAKPVPKTGKTSVAKHVGTVPGTTYAAPEIEAARSAEAAANAATAAAANRPVAAQPTPRQPAPAPVAAPRPAVAAKGFVVQLGAFANKATAESLAQRTGATVSAKGRLWRVRVGPYPTEAAARSACESLANKGVEVARVMRADG